MIFEHPFFVEMLLPFLLVFVLTFAILQKTKLLGDGKSQIDAIIAFVLGLLLIVAPTPRNIIVGILPWLGVAVAVILVFMVIFGFVAGDLSGEGMPNSLKITFGVLGGVFTLGVVLVVTGLGDMIINWFSSGSFSGFFANAVMILAVVVVVVVAMRSGKGGGDKPK